MADHHKKSALDDLFGRLKTHQELVGFGVPPLSAFEAVFGRELVRNPEKMIRAIEKEIRDAGHDISLR
jgi:hypothetical protein